MLRVLRAAVLLLLTAAAAAQQRPIFDPDDFVDPRQRQGRPLFASRLVAGVAVNFIDDYRPLGQNAGFLHIANSVYWSNFQIDYKHTELRGEDGTEPVQLCGCSEDVPIYFPTPPLPNATPLPPPPGSKETVQFAWYRARGDPGSIPLMMRYRLSLSWQPIDTDIFSAATGETTRMSGSERSIGFDADTHFRVGGRDVFGSLQYARTIRTGTVDNRSQNEVTYTSRLPAVAIRRLLLRPTLTVGGVTGRGGSVLNIVSPAVEAFWHDPTTRANFHLIWMPQSTRSGADGWRTTHQIAFFIDRALYVKLFR
ncbi:MAG TPA: hypothetical protein VEK57_05730 [Thermoanaerobaculia bacterium]|nr:hypothetical protein [Thermoanaerobaculia bacterium]